MIAVAAHALAGDEIRAESWAANVRSRNAAFAGLDFFRVSDAVRGQQGASRSRPRALWLLRFKSYGMPHRFNPKGGIEPRHAVFQSQPAVPRAAQHDLKRSITRDWPSGR